MRDSSKSPRNELRFGFCMPSSCTKKDLKQALEQQVADYSNKTEITLEVELHGKSCQVYEEHLLNIGDKIFLYDYIEIDIIGCN